MTQALTSAQQSILNTFRTLRTSLESSIAAARLERERIERLRDDSSLLCVVMLKSDSSMALSADGAGGLKLAPARGGLDETRKWSFQAAKFFASRWNDDQRIAGTGLEVEVVRVPEALDRIIENDGRLYEQLWEMVTEHKADPVLEAELRQVLGMAPAPEVGA